MQLGFGSADIVNLFPEISNGKVKLSIADDKENIQKIEESAESADKIIYAVGTGHQNNAAFQKMICTQKLDTFGGAYFCR